MASEGVWVVRRAVGRLVGRDVRVAIVAREQDLPEEAAEAAEGGCVL